MLSQNLRKWARRGAVSPGFVVFDRDLKAASVVMSISAILSPRFFSVSAVGARKLVPSSLSGSRASGREHACWWQFSALRWPVRTASCRWMLAKSCWKSGGGWSSLHLTTGTASTCGNTTGVGLSGGLRSSSGSMPLILAPALELSASRSSWCPRSHSSRDMAVFVVFLAKHTDQQLLSLAMVSGLWM